MSDKFDRVEQSGERKLGNAGQCNDIDPFKDFRIAQPVMKRQEVEPTTLPKMQLVEAEAALPAKSVAHTASDRLPGGGKPPDDGPPSLKNVNDVTRHQKIGNGNITAEQAKGGKYGLSDFGNLTLTDKATDINSRTTTGKTILDSNFKNLDGFKPSGNDTVQLTKGDAMHPTIAKMVLDRNQDKVPYRTELSANSNAETLKFGHEYSIKFTNRLVDWKTDSAADSIFQLHAIPADGQWTSMQNGKQTGLGGPEVMLRTSNGEYHFYSGKKEIWHGKIEEGKWNDWEIKMRVDGTPGSNGNGKDGYLDLYRNGKLLASADGVNVAGVGAKGEPLKQEVYAKIGIYKWPWKDGRPATQSSRREIDYSNFRITELGA